MESRPGGEREATHARRPQRRSSLSGYSTGNRARGSPARASGFPSASYPRTCPSNIRDGGSRMKTPKGARWSPAARGCRSCTRISVTRLRCCPAPARYRSSTLAIAAVAHVSNLEQLQELYGAFGRGEIEPVLAALAPDVEWVAGDIEGLRRRSRLQHRTWYTAVRRLRGAATRCRSASRPVPGRTAR